MFCSGCGNQLGTEARFCKHCGKAISRKSGAEQGNGTAPWTELQRLAAARGIDGPLIKLVVLALAQFVVPIVFSIVLLVIAWRKVWRWSFALLASGTTTMLLALVSHFFRERGESLWAAFTRHQDYMWVAAMVVLAIGTVVFFYERAGKVKGLTAGRAFAFSSLIVLLCLCWPLYGVAREFGRRDPLSQAEVEKALGLFAVYAGKSWEAAVMNSRGDEIWPMTIGEVILDHDAYGTIRYSHSLTLGGSNYAADFTGHRSSIAIPSEIEYRRRKERLRVKYLTDDSLEFVWTNSNGEEMWLSAISTEHAKRLDEQKELALAAEFEQRRRNLNAVMAEYSAEFVSFGCEPQCWASFREPQEGGLTLFHPLYTSTRLISGIDLSALVPDKRRWNVSTRRTLLEDEYGSGQEWTEVEELVSLVEVSAPTAAPVGSAKPSAAGPTSRATPPKQKQAASMQSSDAVGRLYGYGDTDTPPSFQGGDAGRIQWFKANLRYPQAELEAQHVGKPWVEFVVEPSGIVTNVVLKKSSGYPALDSEALRLIRAMPSWTPGKVEGKSVRTLFRLPVPFTL